MLRSFIWDLPVARIAALVLASLPVAMLAAPTHDSDLTSLPVAMQLSADSQASAAEAPESPSDDSVRVPIWIPGFDDVDPAFTCSPTAVSHLTRFSGKPRFGNTFDDGTCNGSRRLLPWNSAPAPEVRIRYSPLVV